MKNMRKKFVSYAKRIINSIATNKLPVFLGAFGLVFPWILSLFYGCNTAGRIGSYGDVLSYYGVYFGVVVSYVTYRFEKERKDRLHMQEIRPKIELSVVESIAKGAFTLSIDNCGLHPLKQVYFEGDFLCTRIEKSFKVNIIFSIETKDELLFDNEYPVIFIPQDDGGFPSNLLLNCDDSDNNTWAFEFKKQPYSEQSYYSLTDYYII